MFYEEKMIDGVLCFRTTPKGEWCELSYSALTEKCVRADNARARLQAVLDRIYLELESCTSTCCAWHVVENIKVIIEVGRG